MDQIMVYIWLGIVVLSLVGEAVSMDMTSIWFSVGGIASIIAWFIWNTGTGSIILQVVLFVCVSLTCLCTLRRVCKKFLLRKDNEKTNVNALSGNKFKLITSITNEQKGTIKINDVIWACISDNADEIEAGSTVEIVKVSGNKMIVRKVDEPVIQEEKPKEVVKKTRTKKTSSSGTFKDQSLL